MRLYRLLLLLYPSSFRQEYGGEMCALFVRRRRDVTSLFGLAALWLSTFVEVATNAIAVHWDMLRSDLRYSRRTLAHSKGFTLTAILVVGLGVGATTAAFSVTDFVLIRPLPFPDGDQLVKLWQRTPGYSRMELSPALYRDWKSASRSYESLGAYHPLAVNMLGNGEPMPAGRLIGSPPICFRRSASGRNRPHLHRVRRSGWRARYPDSELPPLADRVRRRRRRRRPERGARQRGLHHHRRDAAGVPFSHQRRGAVDDNAAQRGELSGSGRQLAGIGRPASVRRYPGASPRRDGRACGSIEAAVSKGTRRHERIGLPAA